MNNKLETSFLLPICLMTFTCLCQTNNFQVSYFEKEVKKKETNLKLTRSALEITTPDTNAINKFSVLENGSDSYFAFFDQYQKKVKVVSLTRKKIIKRIDVSKILNPEWPVESIYFQNFDSTFLLQFNELSVIDSCGLQKWILRVDKSEKYHDGYKNFGDCFNIFFDSIQKKIFLGRSRVHESLYTKAFFKEPLLVSFDLKEKKITRYPVTYSEKYQEHFYGDVNYPNHILKDSLSIFNFFGDPNIYVYNRNSGLKIIEGGKSKFHTSVKELPEKFREDTNKKLEHIIHSPIYYQILWDKYRKFYYRVFMKELPIKNSEGFYTTWSDKISHLIIFDEDFNYLSEIKLEKGESHHFMFVAKEGLHILNMGKLVLNPKIMIFDVLNFEK